MAGLVLDFTVSRTSDLLHFVVTNLCPHILEFARYRSTSLFRKIRLNPNRTLFGGVLRPFLSK